MTSESSIPGLFLGVAAFANDAAEQRLHRQVEARRNAAFLTVLHVPVEVRLDDGSVVPRILTQLPWQLGSGDWVCGISGQSGGYCCARVTRPRLE